MSSQNAGRTLSPMDSFASELGIPFEFQMEAPHVVDMEKQVLLLEPYATICCMCILRVVKLIIFPQAAMCSRFSRYQVWAAAVSTGPDNVSLNASYKNADGYSFQVL